MRLPQPFIRLPLAFDAASVRGEVAQFSPDEWRPHPQGHPGNWALSLIAPHGDPLDEGVVGPMEATPHLARCPYIRQIMGALEAPLGRSRLMKLDARAEATPHVDIHYYWMQRVRVHVPIVTFPEVRFLCGDASTHMAAGECWIFDTWRRHNVLNPTADERIHLVVDTVGSEAFWALADEGASAPRAVPFAQETAPALVYEQFNLPVVMSPWEFDALWGSWLDDARRATAGVSAVEALAAAVRPIQCEWRALWARYGSTEPGWPAFAALIEELEQRARAPAAAISLPNGLSLATLVTDSLVAALHTPQRNCANGSVSTHIPDLGQMRTPMPAPARATPSARTPRFDRPVVIIAAPRSGSSLLFETLAQSPSVHTVGNESHRQFESIAALRPDARGFESNRLVAADATPEIAADVTQRFAASMHDRDGRRPAVDTSQVRLLEKTPKNALRVPFLDAVFPDAFYVYLYRDPEENLSSLIEGWQSGRFVTYPELPGWPGPPWSFLLVPGWRDLVGAPLPAIVAAQWQRTQDILLEDLAALPKDRIIALSYRDFLAAPEAHVREIAKHAGIDWDRPLPAELPLSAHTVTPPAPDKWRRHEALLAPYLSAVSSTADRARRFVADCRAHHANARPTLPESPSIARPAKTPSVPEPAPQLDPHVTAEALASVHTSNLPQILGELKASLLITTFQAGKLILARADGATLNTHFVGFKKPMGLAANHDRFFVGTETGIREFRNVPAVSAKLDPPHRHDAVYVFRNHHVTANIEIHEIAIADGECWYVNTLFSCLCVLDHDHSFVPRWRPRFITGLAPEDRCHLNGLAMMNGKPKFLTALGESDTPQGWRENKKDGGILLDYAAREPVVRGLSMPHSPRWYRGRLWLLESGRGSLATVDLASGKVETVARVPGFTRGLDFIGPLAFIGLSQLRKSNAFTDIPITEDNADRMSGVWVVNIETGNTVAFLKFSNAVQEIFTVQALPGALFPAIIDDDDELINTTYVLPDDALKEVRFSAPAADEAAAEANAD